MPKDSRRGTSYMPLDAARERAMREDAGDAGLVVGYASPSGPKPLPGDERFPHVMVPPEVSEAELLVSLSTPLTPTTTFYNGVYTSPAIDVRGIRRLTYFVQYVIPYIDGAPAPEVPANALAFFPQVASEAIKPWGAPHSSIPYFDEYDPAQRMSFGSRQWFALSVLDPVIRGVAPTAQIPATSLLPGQYGFRNAYMTQINVPHPSTAVPQRIEVETVLVFDVAPYEWFRLLYAAYDDLRGEDTNTPILEPEGGDPIFRLWVQKER